MKLIKALETMIALLRTIAEQTLPPPKKKRGRPFGTVNKKKKKVNLKKKLK